MKPFVIRESGLAIPVNQLPDPPAPPPPPKGRYGESWEDEGFCCHEWEAWGGTDRFEINVKAKGLDRGPSAYQMLKRITLCVNACEHLSDDDLRYVLDEKNNVSLRVD